MSDLTDVLIELPTGLVHEWENYFWYATGPSISALPIFKNAVGEGKFIEKGQWIEKGDPILSFSSYNVHVRSPYSGIVHGIGSSGTLLLRPIKGFTFREDSGNILFREVVAFGHRIENEIVAYEAKTKFQKLYTDLFKNGQPFGYSKSWKYDSQRRKALLDELDKLLQAKCHLKKIES
jgi:hypothetical protein